MLTRTRQAIYSLITLATLLALGAEGAESSYPARAQGENQAGLVIQFADGRIQSYCIPFSGESITGLDLLLKTGLDVQVESYGGMGAEICKIGANGCDYPNQPCACRSYGPGGVYWSYSHLKNGKWQMSSVGVGSYKVRNGDIEGWAWSSGKPPAASPSLAEICGSAAIQTQATSTRQAPTPTRILPRATATTALSTATRKARSTATGTVTAIVTATAISAKLTSTPQLPTPTALSTPTSTPTDPPSSSPTGIFSPTGTPTPEATETASLAYTPTVLPTAANGATLNPEAQAGTVGVVIGASLLAGLAIFAIRRRSRESVEDNGHVE